MGRVFFALLIAAAGLVGCTDDRTELEKLLADYGHSVYLSNHDGGDFDGVVLCGAICIDVPPGKYYTEDLIALGLVEGGVNVVVFTMASLNRGDIVNVIQPVGEAIERDVSIGDWCFESQEQDYCKGKERGLFNDAVKGVYRAPHNQIIFVLDYDGMVNPVYGFEFVRADPFTLKFYIGEQGIVAE